MSGLADLGDFEPQHDPHAAVKFVLNLMHADDRLGELHRLLEHRLGGIEGDPGWILERRALPELGEQAESPPWPDGAMFRAYVEPDAYELAHPECFLTREQFEGYVEAALNAK